MKPKFYQCPKCGNIIELIEEKADALFCCGEKMPELTANTKEAAVEKHIPVIEIEERAATIKVGEVLHPMTSEHYISWIYVVTNKRIVRYNLTPDMDPIINLSLQPEEQITNAYAYCNLHSLWQKELK